MKNKKTSKSIDEKLKTKSLMFFVYFFSCELQDFKFWYENRKVFGASFLYWVYFNNICPICDLNLLILVYFFIEGFK